MDLLIDLYQQGRIRQAEESAEDAKHAARQVRDDVQDLKRKADALTIACQAMWELLQKHAGLAEGEIIAKMREIDLRDGRADGRISATPVACPRCTRQSSSNRKTCLYCGTPLPGGQIFEAL